jgi:hypothetical protein
METQRIFLTVRLWHPSFKADEITSKIKYKSTSIQNAGEKFKTPIGRETEIINKETFVVYDFPTNNDDLSEAIKKANSFLFDNFAFFNELKRTGGRCDYYITLRAEKKYTFIISPEVFNDCSKLGVDLGVEIFFE